MQLTAKYVYIVLDYWGLLTVLRFALKFYSRKSAKNAFCSYNK